MTDTELKAAVAACFTAVNGRHPMTPEDDAYADEWYAPLERVAGEAGADPASCDA